MFKNDNLIKLLGLENKDINVDILKKAYRKKALILHPDKGGSEDDFKQLHNAYSKLLELINNKEIFKPSRQTTKANITLYNIFVSKEIVIKLEDKTETIKINGFREYIYLSNIEVQCNLILNSHFRLDHNAMELRNIIEVTYLDTYFVDDYSIYYTFIDGSKYKINYKKNNITKDVFYLPDKCNFMYSNKTYKFAICIECKKPCNEEIKLIEDAVKKYTKPKDNHFTSQQSTERKDIDDIINDLDNMKLKDIKELCKKNKIAGYSYYNKKELISYVREYLSRQ